MTKDKILKVKGSNLCIYDNIAKADGNDINDALYTCIGSTGAMNWVEHFMTSDLDECPHIVRESDDNDYILEIVRAMKFAGQKGKKFSRKVDDKISKYGEMIALPNGKTISDVTLSINSKDLSFDINEDNIYESSEIREWTGKNNVMLGFGKKDGDKYPLEITCNWDCVKDLKEYIYDSKKENKSEFVPIERVISSDYHIKQDPGECLKACQKIVESAGFTYNKLNVMVLVANVNGNNYDFHQDCVHKSVQVIDENLENGKPVIVGVDYKDGSSNFDKVTDHWIVITSRGKDDIGIYYSYFEVARAINDGGASNDNKLYLQQSGILEGKCTCKKNVERHYLVTMVRPVDDFSFKCCGREIYQYNDFSQEAKEYCKECEIEPGYYNKSDEQQSNIIIKP